MDKKEIKILLIEDNPADARLVFEMLKGIVEPVFKITHAGMLDDGMKKLKNGKFDACILDVGLPDSRGFEGLEKISKEYPTVPVILFTGVDDENLGIEAMHNTAADYLVKGRIDTTLLVRSIRYGIERKKLETVLREREQRLRLATDVGKLGVFIWNVKSDEVYWKNDLMYAIFGYSLADKPLNKLEFMQHAIYKEDAVGFAKKLREGLKRGRITGLICRIRRKNDAAIRWVEFSGCLDTTSEPGFIRAICIVRDITERKETERMLEREHDFLEKAVRQRTNDLNKANEILERVFSSTHFCIVYLDSNFNFIRVNNAYANACGHSCEFFIGKNHFALYPNEENQGIFKKVVETGKPFSVYAKPFEFPDHPEWGVTFWDWSLQPVRDEANEIKGLIFSMLDVTKKKQAEEELKKASLELDKSKRLSDIGVLAATVAHELRNPLAAINMAAHNIKRKAANPLLNQHIENIEKKVFESDQIINNLLFYSRIRKPHIENVRIDKLLEECLAAAGGKEKNGITIKSKLKPLENISIEADSLQIREVFQNILNNAKDAVCEGSGKIEVEVVNAKDSLRIYLKDNGAGISKESIGRIFEPFFTTKAKGTGLGLTVCQQIVALHNGFINIESEPGNGTTVIVTLPKKSTH
ncbi:MAG: ATP-binding protein [Candidatus Omnitrophica bacterium]|nr:ATP-binding protein [Candidatus Omnitrophota bacterium]